MVNKKCIPPTTCVPFFAGCSKETSRDAKHWHFRKRKSPEPEKLSLKSLRASKYACNWFNQNNQSLLATSVHCDNLRQRARKRYKFLEFVFSVVMNEKFLSLLIIPDPFYHDQLCCQQFKSFTGPNPFCTCRELLNQGEQ